MNTEAKTYDGEKGFLTLIDRIVSDRKIRITQSDYSTAHANPNTGEISINFPYVYRETNGDVDFEKFVRTIKGLNYHELSHILYTVANMQSIPYELCQIFNILEDCRIENIFSTRYPKARDYFVIANLELLVKHMDKHGIIIDNFPTFYGKRQFIPPTVVKTLMRGFLDEYGEGATYETMRIVDEYLTCHDTKRQVELCQELHDLLKGLRPTAFDLIIVTSEMRSIAKGKSGLNASKKRSKALTDEAKDDMEQSKKSYEKALVVMIDEEDDADGEPDEEQDGSDGETGEQGDEDGEQEGSGGSSDDEGQDDGESGSDGDDSGKQEDSGDGSDGDDESTDDGGDDDADSDVGEQGDEDGESGEGAQDGGSDGSGGSDSENGDADESEPEHEDGCVECGKTDNLSECSECGGEFCPDHMDVDADPKLCMDCEDVGDDGQSDEEEDADGESSDGESGDGSSDGSDGNPDGQSDGEGEQAMDGGTGGGADPMGRDFAGAGMDMEKIKEELSEAIEDYIEQVNEHISPDIDYDIDSIRYHKEKDCAPPDEINVTNKMRESSVKVAEHLRRIRSGLENTYVPQQRSGRLNLRKAMTYKRNGETKIFKKFTPDQINKTHLGVVILIDSSGSMEGKLEKACGGAWILNDALNKLSGNYTCILTYSGEDVELIKSWHGKTQWGRLYAGGWTPAGMGYKKAIDEIEQLRAERGVRNFIVINLSDGAWSDTAIAEKMINRLKSMQVETMELMLKKKGQIDYLIEMGIDPKETYSRLLHNSHHTDMITNLDDFPDMMGRVINSVATNVRIAINKGLV